VVSWGLDFHDASRNDSIALHRHNNLLARVGGSLGPGTRSQLLLEVVDHFVRHYSNVAPVLPSSGVGEVPCSEYQLNWTSNSYPI